MNIRAIEKIYVRQLKEIYSVEKQMLEILPKVIKVISNKDFKAVLKNHLEHTKLQTARIQKSFQHFGNSKPAAADCGCIASLISELENLTEEAFHSERLDAELILILQKIEHYEIASYSSLVTYSRLLGHEQSREMLQESLDEEFDADNKLDRLSEEIINMLLMKHA